MHTWQINFTPRNHDRMTDREMRQMQASSNDHLTGKQNTQSPEERKAAAKAAAARQDISNQNADMLRELKNLLSRKAYREFIDTTYRNTITPEDRQELLKKALEQAKQARKGANSA